MYLEKRNERFGEGLEDLDFVLDMCFFKYSSAGLQNKFSDL
jgi:hypothetical protein